MVLSRDPAVAAKKQRVGSASKSGYQIVREPSVEERFDKMPIGLDPPPANKII